MFFCPTLMISVLASKVFCDVFHEVVCDCDIKSENSKKGHLNQLVYELPNYEAPSSLKLPNYELTKSAKVTDLIKADFELLELNNSESSFLEPESKSESFNPQVLKCLEEEQYIDTLKERIIWKETESEKTASSLPLCLDKDFKIKRRRCQAGTWDEQPDCASVQKEIKNPCPEGLENINDKYCYKIVQNTSFPPKCPYPDIIGWEEYIKLELTAEPIWMPVQRKIEETYGIDVLRFTEPSDNYKVPYDFCKHGCQIYFYSDNFTDKMCQVYHNSTHVEGVRCDEKHSALCVYYALPIRNSSFCSQAYPGGGCRQNAYNADSLCFCEALNKNDFNDIEPSVLAEFSFPYQNLLYKSLKETYQIGLRNYGAQEGNPFRWTASFSIINYTNWDTDLEINFNYKFGAISSNGWTLQESYRESSLSLYQIPTPQTSGSLILDFKKEECVLAIHNYTTFLSNDNGEPIVYCFTDADATSLIYRIHDFSSKEKNPKNTNKYTYRFPYLNISQSGPGNYWCEAFLYPNLTVVQSNIKRIYNYKAEFVLILKVTQYVEKLSRFPVTKENFATLQNLLKNELTNILPFFPRLFKINEIDEGKKELTATFHLTSVEANYTQDIYDELKAASMALPGFKFVDFRSVDFCPNTVTNQQGGQVVWWPYAPLDEDRDPENGYCVTENATMIKRKCTGNFIDGAYWSEITENCTFYPSSTLTKKLLNIEDCDETEYDTALKSLYEITDSYELFKTLDLVIAANFLMKVSKHKPDLEKTAGIVNNLMKISAVVLSSAQLNFKATDTLLLTIDTVLENGDFDEHQTENFAIKSVIITEGITGILLKNCSTTKTNNCDLIPIKKDTSFNESFISNNNVEAAIVLSDTLFNQIVKYKKNNPSFDAKLTISIYYGSQLFIEARKFSKYVFGVLLPGFKEDFEGPVTIYYFKPSTESVPDYNCSYWQFDASKYGLWTTEITETIHQAVVCKFYHVTHFGLPTSLPGKVSESRKKLKGLDALLCYDYKLIKFHKPFSNEIGLCKTLANNADKHLLGKYCFTSDRTAIPLKCFDNFKEDLNTCPILNNSCTTYRFFGSLENFTNLTLRNKICCWDFILDVMFIVSQFPLSLTDFDVALVLSALQPMGNGNEKPNLKTVAGIINNLMKVPRPVLYSAQVKFKALDKLSESLEQTLQLGPCTDLKTENFLTKCVYLSGGITGITIKSCSNDLKDCILDTVTLNQQIDTKMFVSSNIQASIMLDRSLYNQVMSYSYVNTSFLPKMIVSVYSGPQLFLDMHDPLSETEEVSRFVFGILLPDFPKTFTDPLVVKYYNISSDEKFNFQYNCSYWKIDSDSDTSTSLGFWKTERTINTANQVATCEFYHVTNFAIAKYFSGDNSNIKHNTISTSRNKLFCFNQKILPSPSALTEISTNVENDLKNNYFLDFTDKTALTTFGNTWNTLLFENNLLISPDTNMNNSDKAFELSPFTCNNKVLSKDKMYHANNTNKNTKIAELQQILDVYNLEDLTANDVRFIAKILYETSKITVADTLPMFANIVSILMKVPKNVMSKAQDDFFATDKILIAINLILRNFETTIQTINENLIFYVISKENTAGFFGFCVTYDKNIINISNEDGYNKTFKEKTNHFCVKIGKNLHKQLGAKQSRIIFVVFYNDVYFPDVRTNTIIHPIIEIVFPDLQENLDGDFTITYNNVSKDNTFYKCSYWNHTTTYNDMVNPGSWIQEFLPQRYDTLVACAFKHATHFALVHFIQNITTHLEIILNSNLTGLEKLKQVNSITTKNYDSLVPVDIFLISQIMKDSLVDGAMVDVISQIVSNLFNVPNDILKESQKAHMATDNILNNVDEMAGMADDTFISHNNFALVVKDLKNSDLTGLILRNCYQSQCTIEELHKAVNISEFSNDTSLSAMLLFSESLVEQIKNLKNNSKAVVSVYHTNALFNEIDKDRRTTKIFGVVFPGLETSLDGMVTVVYNNNATETKNNNNCAYWNYKVDAEDTEHNVTHGQWVDDAPKEQQSQLSICNFKHITHFAMLVADDDEYINDELLSIITAIGCVLSLVGLSVILLTALAFKNWRRNTGNKILINFSVAISLKIAMLYISDYVKSTSSGIACTITGVILHYALLSEFSWMLIIAILQFRRFVDVLGGPPKYILVKALISGWVFPVIPVLCVVFIDSENYTKGNSGLCYPSELGLYLGVWLPVLIIVTINCVIFTFIIYNVFHKKTECIDTSNHDVLFQWRLALLLFFMLGLTWLFGFFSEINADILFTYLFCISASLQGFVLFLFFVVFNKSTRFLYSQTAKQWFYSRGIFRLWNTQTSRKH